MKLLSLVLFSTVLSLLPLQAQDVKPAAPAVSRKDERRAEAEARQRIAAARKPFEKKLAAIEAELAPLAAESREAEAWLITKEIVSGSGSGCCRRAARTRTAGRCGDRRGGDR